jgi:hypothetical protein
VFAKDYRTIASKNNPNLTASARWMMFWYNLRFAFVANQAAGPRGLGRDPNQSERVPGRVNAKEQELD